MTHRRGLWFRSFLGAVAVLAGGAVVARTEAPTVRARDLGIPFPGSPGPFNAITDVAGVAVGYRTIIRGDSVRTGVTAILPRGKTNPDPVYAGSFVLNGNGEVTGLEWIQEGGFLESPVVLTTTHSIGAAHDAVIRWQGERAMLPHRWSLPVVGETLDGYLNDAAGFHVKRSHVFAALDSAVSGQPIAEGNVGGGTGMVCFEFKGGTGTASRTVAADNGGFTVGVLVQANFGVRWQLTLGGKPLGRLINEQAPYTDGRNVYDHGDTGSIIGIVATDAPLLPHQLDRLAKRAALGVARVGGTANNGSGDLFLAFSTANPGIAFADAPAVTIQTVSNGHITPLFYAAALATEEAIANALVAAETMVGRDGHCVIELPEDRVREIFAETPRGSVP